MKLLSVLMFIFAFTIEVRVRASDHHNHKAKEVSSVSVVETPEQCLESYGYCVIKNLNQKYSYQGEGFLISLSPESIIIRQKLKEISFVKGQIFVKANSKMSFQTPYGQIEVEKDSQALLEKFSDKVVVQTIFGKVFLKPLGEKKSILVMQGHENYVAQVGDSLKAQTGIPKPVMIEPLLKTWFYHANLSKEKFTEEVESFKSVHEKAVQDLSILNEQIATREIASAKAERMAAEERARKAKEHHKKMQETYMKRLLTE